MALTREFINTIKEKADNDPGFRVSMLRSAVAAFINGEAALGRLTLRDYVNATIGFEGLAKGLGEFKPQSLMRMLSKDGNPRSENLSASLAYLQKHEGVSLDVVSVDKPRELENAWTCLDVLERLASMGLETLKDAEAMCRVHRTPRWMTLELIGRRPVPPSLQVKGICHSRLIAPRCGIRLQCAYSGCGSAVRVQIGKHWTGDFSTHHRRRPRPGRHGDVRQRSRGFHPELVKSAPSGAKF